MPPSFALDFATTGVAHRFPALMDPQEMMARLLATGVEWIGLAIAMPLVPVFDVEIPVWDDAVFLGEAFAELAELDQEGQADVHEVFLGDGLIDITSQVGTDTVEMRLLYSPYLDKRFSQEHRCVVSRQTYISAWAALASALQSAAAG